MGSAARVFGLTVALAACSGEEKLTLRADPPALAADGLTIVELTAEVVFRGDALEDGEDVVLRATEALLFESEEEVSPGEGASEVEVSTRGGKARAYLLAPTDAASLHIEATYTTVNRDVLADSLLLRARSAPLISAGSFEDDTSQMVTHFGISCSTRNIGGVDNIGAFVPRDEDIRLPCSLVLQDHRGRDLPHTPISFFTEAGVMEDLPADDGDPRQITYVVPPSPVVLPRDTEPIGAETSRSLVDFDGTGRSVNPRDGLVTILAAVRGHEAFSDRNGNGRHDAGEPFLDEGEPFLDVDDDGAYDASVDQACCDSNGNHEVDGPNGRFDEDVWIGRLTHVLWSGPVSTQHSHIIPSGPTIDAGSSTTLELRIVDDNFNPVAASDVDDRVAFDLTPSTKVSFQPPAGMSPDEAPLPNSIGMDLLGFPDFLFGYDTPVLVDLTMDLPTEHFRDFPVILNDIRTGTARCSAASFTFEVTVYATPAPGDYDRSALLSTTGLLNAKPSPCP